MSAAHLTPVCPKMVLNGRGGGIRTPDPLLPKQVKRLIEAYWNGEKLTAFD